MYNNTTLTTTPLPQKLKHYTYNNITLIITTLLYNNSLYYNTLILTVNPNIKLILIYGYNNLFFFHYFAISKKKRYFRLLSLREIALQRNQVDRYRVNRY